MDQLLDMRFLLAAVRDRKKKNNNKETAAADLGNRRRNKKEQKRRKKKKLWTASSKQGIKAKRKSNEDKSTLLFWRALYSAAYFLRNLLILTYLFIYNLYVSYPISYNISE